MTTGAGHISVGYVANNWSQGRVQVQRFGYDDAVSDTTNLKWAYPAASEQTQTAGVGSHVPLQAGSRVLLMQVGHGSDCSYVSMGAFGRMGSGSTGGVGSGAGEDSTTMAGDVNQSQTDWVIPSQNPNSPDGTRVQAKAPSGQYNPQAGGQPYDPSQNQYPNTKYKDA